EARGFPALVVRAARWGDRADQVTGSHGGEVERPTRTGEVLLGVLAARERVLRDHPRPDAALAGVMDDRQVGEMTDLPAIAAHAQAQVRLFGVDEEAFVEEPRAQQRLAPGEHERTRRPVARDLAVVLLEVELALAGPLAAHRPLLRAERLEQ